MWCLQETFRLIEVSSTACPVIFTLHLIVCSMVQPVIVELLILGFRQRGIPVWTCHDERMWFVHCVANIKDGQMTLYANRRNTLMLNKYKIKYQHQLLFLTAFCMHWLECIIKLIWIIWSWTILVEESVRISRFFSYISQSGFIIEWQNVRCLYTNYVYS